MAVALDGLLTFYSWHHALRAEKVLSRSGFGVQLIPAPRELSPNCGTALRFDYRRRQEALEVLAASRVQVEASHYYMPELEKAESPARVPHAAGPRCGWERPP